MAERLILVVDDDPAVASMLRRALRAEGLAVEIAETGNAALDAIEVIRPDLIVLDLGLPDIGGLEVCRRIRSDDDETPVLMLTARSAVADRVTGLETGADDYLGKPFALEELLARLKALLRRRPPAAGVMRYDDIVLDSEARTVTRAGEPLDLTRREFDLLDTFMRHPSQVLDRYQLMADVWGYDFDIETNTVDVYVGYLRRKLEDGDRSRVLQTVRGIGFALRER